jgi:hypothetical protein
MGCFGAAWSVSVVQGGAIDPAPILYQSGGGESWRIQVDL